MDDMATPARKLTLSKDILLATMQSPAVTEALEHAANVIANNVETEAAADEDEDTYDRVSTSDVYVETGIRPAGRPYAYVHISRDDGYNDEENARREREAAKRGVEHEHREPFTAGKRRTLNRLAAKYNTPRN